MSSFHIKEWVYIQFGLDEPFNKCYIINTLEENGTDAYEVKWEDGSKEIALPNSIHRIIPVHQTKAKIIDFNKKRKKLLKLVNN